MLPAWDPTGCEPQKSYAVRTILASAGLSLPNSFPPRSPLWDPKLQGRTRPSESVYTTDCALKLETGPCRGQGVPTQSLTFPACRDCGNFLEVTGQERFQLALLRSLEIKEMLGLQRTPKLKPHSYSTTCWAVAPLGEWVGGQCQYDTLHVL